MYKARWAEPAWCVAAVLVIGWAAATWPEQVTSYIPPLATVVALYVAYLLTTFTQMKRQTRLCLAVTERQLDDNAEILSKVEKDLREAIALLDNQSPVLMLPARRPYLSAWELISGRHDSHLLSDSLVYSMLKLRRKMEFLSAQLDAFTETVGEQAPVNQGKLCVARAKSMVTLSEETRQDGADVKREVCKERGEFGKRAGREQMVRLATALGLLSVVVLCTAHGQSTRASRHAAGTAINRDASAPVVVRATRFEVVDRRGNVTALLGVDPIAGTGLAIRSADGKALASLTLLQGALPVLSLDDGGGGGIDAAVGRNGSYLYLRDHRGKARVAVDLDGQDTPRITLHGPYTEPTGKGTLQTGEVLWRAP